MKAGGFEKVPLTAGKGVVKAVAVTPDGSKTIVTGASYGLGTGQDFAAVAYQA